MFEPLRQVFQQYKDIAAERTTEMALSQARQLNDWLQYDVGRIVESLLTLPGFRRRVLWPIDLAASHERSVGAFASPERDAVVAVDRGLVNLAEQLKEYARSEPVRGCLNSTLETLRGDRDSRGEIEQLLAKADNIARRSAGDLVRIGDYFDPTQPPVGEERMQVGSFLPCLNPRLRSPGDFVSQCLEIRVSEAIEDLEKLYRRICQADLEDRQRRSDELEMLASGLADLRSSKATLDRLCFDGSEARIRDSCIALLQVYVAYRPEMDLSWLDVSSDAAVGVADIPDRVLHRRQWDVPERIASALLDIAGLKRSAQLPQDMIEYMRARKRLVLVEEQRKVFLDGEYADNLGTANWNGKHHLLWELLWTLAERAQRGRTVDRYCRLTNLSNVTPTARDQQPEPPSSQAVKDRRSDLKRIITPELNALIKSAKSGGYCLNLPPEQICLLGWGSEEYLEEIESSALHAILDSHTDDSAQ